MRKLIIERARLCADNHRDNLAYAALLGRLAGAAGVDRVINLDETGGALVVADGEVRPATEIELNQIEWELQEIARRQE